MPVLTVRRQNPAELTWRRLPVVDFKIHWLNMMSMPERRAAVATANGIYGRDNRFAQSLNGKGRRTTTNYDDVELTSQQLGRQDRKPFIISIRIPRFDDDVFPFDNQRNAGERMRRRAGGTVVVHGAVLLLSDGRQRSTG